MKRGRLEPDDLKGYVVGAWDSYIRERHEGEEEERVKEGVRWVLGADGGFRCVLPKSGERSWRMLTTLGIDELSGRWEVPAKGRLRIQVGGLRLPLFGTFLSKWTEPLVALSNAWSPWVFEWDWVVVGRNVARLRLVAPEGASAPEYVGEEWRRIAAG